MTNRTQRTATSELEVLVWVENTRHHQCLEYYAQGDSRWGMSKGSKRLGFELVGYDGSLRIPDALGFNSNLLDYGGGMDCRMYRASRKGRAMLKKHGHMPQPRMEYFEPIRHTVYTLERYKPLVKDMWCQYIFDFKGSHGLVRRVTLQCLSVVCKVPVQASDYTIFSDPREGSWRDQGVSAYLRDWNGKLYTDRFTMVERVNET